MCKLLKPRFILLLLCLAIAIARLHTYSEPRSYDITYFAVVGHGLLHGHSLYSQFWDNKPPAPYLTYAAAELIAGYGRFQIYLLGLLAALVGLFGVYAATYALTEDTKTALWSAAFWSVISSSLQLGANEPNCEVFMNACAVWVFALVAGRSSQEISTRQSLLLGMILTLGTLYKPFFIVNALFLAIVHISVPLAGKHRRAIKDVRIWILTGLAGWALTVGYFVVTHRWGIFYASNVTYNHFYSPHPFLELAFATPYFVNPILKTLVNYIPLIGLIFVGVIAGIGNTPKRTKWLLLTFAFVIYIGVAVPGRFFQHYFQLWLPFLAIAGGWGLRTYEKHFHQRWRHLPSAFFLGMLAMTLLVTNEIPYYRLGPLESSAEIDQNGITDTYELSSKIQPLLLPGEKLVQFGNNPGFYFFAHRSSPTGVLFAYHLSGPLGKILKARFINDVNITKPELLIYDTNASPFAYGRDLQSLLTEQYIPIGQVYKWRHFELRMRKGGALAARLQNHLESGLADQMISELQQQQ